MYVLMNFSFTAEARDKQGKESCPGGNGMKGSTLALTENLSVHIPAEPLKEGHKFPVNMPILCATKL